MSLVESLREKSKLFESTRQEVVEEIKAYFDDYFNSNEFEKYVESISKNHIKDRTIPIKIEFWEYHMGCSDTNFYCCGCKWCNPQNQYSIKSWKYKDVWLRDVQFDVCEYLTGLTLSQMQKLGFEYKGADGITNKMGYYETWLYFGW